MINRRESIRRELFITLNKLASNIKLHTDVENFDRDDFLCLVGKFQSRWLLDVWRKCMVKVTFSIV